MRTLEKERDFEELGFKTMLETQNEQRTKEICGLHISAYDDEIQPAIAAFNSEIEESIHQRHSLWTHLYDRPVPASDAWMLARGVGLGMLAVLFLVAFVTSAAGHMTTFYLFGLGWFTSGILGISLTGLTSATGHLAYEKFLNKYEKAQAVLVLSALLLCFWGLFQLAEARSEMVNKMTASNSSQSYVDDVPSEESQAEPNTNTSQQQKVQGLLSSAIIKIMIAADLIVGILLGIIGKMRSDEDYSAWRKLKHISGALAQMERERNELMSRVGIAGKRCMAGILRASNIPRRSHVPYFRSLRAILLLPALGILQFGAVPAFSQTIEHHEAILLDVSGSVGGGNAQSQRFREYLYAAKRLLLTEPPNSRIWVSTITTESFGSIQELLKGRTPDAQGVFTDDLDRARRQLATSFESRSAGLAPVAAGTDIVGALWHMKTLLESMAADSKRVSKTIWIVSDMMNETPGMLMPALIPLGPQKMLEHAKTNGLIVPLQGYKIYVIGAATTGLSPHSWSTIKEFWILYFREAGAELVSYSVECSVER
jgi:hypothetical protein